MNGRRWLSGAALGLLIPLFGAAGATALEPTSAAGVKAAPNPPDAVRHDLSPPLRHIPPAKRRTGRYLPPDHALPAVPRGGKFDPVVQSSVGAASAPALGLGFEGVGNGFAGPQGTFGVNSAPPDPNGAVGPNHYVQVVNTDFAIFNKSGTPVYGPVPTNTLWSGFGGGCQSNNDGDATVEYDSAADRWVVTQFSVSTTPYAECVAVSQTGDPTGAWYRYAFTGYNAFPDYPKLGVWPDAYFITFNLFSGNFFVGPEVCAYNRAKMLLGQAATQQCYTLSTAYGGLLPSDLDGSTPPPAGSPNYILDFGSNSLEMWKFHPDWATPANTSFTGPTTIPTAAFTAACGGGACIPQVGTSQRLDSLADRLMYRLAYRNFGDHEALVVNHSVTAGTSTGVRWYEVRDPGGSPAVYQQGTYAPDGTYRFMGSAAMDHNGDIAVGFSTSSATLNPGAQYTARLAGDPLGSMTQGEGVLVNGTGSQSGGLNRWGDYTSLNIDPSDDCTFWYTNEYLATTGSFNWHTRIGSFRLPGCGQPDYVMSVSPSSRTVPQSQATSTPYTVTTTPVGGFSDNVDLSVSGLPAGASASFSPNPTTPGSSSSTMTVTLDGTTPAGNYPLTITGTSGALTHSSSVALVVQAPAPDFGLSASPSSRSVVHGSGTSYGVTISRINGFSGNVSLSVSGLPSRTSASFSPNPASSSSTLSVTTNRKTPRGTYTLTITGTSGSLTRTVRVTLVVT